MIKEILENSKKNKKFIGIWNYDDEDSFWSGYVEDYTDDVVYLKHFTKYGKYDGIVIEKIESIKSIDFDDEYSRIMHYLIENPHLLEDHKEISIKKPKTKNWKYEVAKLLVGDTNSVLRIIMENEDTYTGRVVKLDKEHIVLNLLDSDGIDLNLSLFKFDDITSMRINDIEGRKRLIAYKWRKGL